MHLRTTLLAVLILALGCSPSSSDGGPQGPAPAGTVPEPTEQDITAAAEDFDEVRAGYLEWYFEAHPVRATELGVHDHDGRLPSMSRTGIQRRIDSLLEWLADIEQIRFDLMRDEYRYDYAVLEYGIRSELLDLEEARSWANDPGVYTEVIGRGLASVAEREYTSLEQRTGALHGRLTAARGVLESARENVRRPPRVWTELALADARGLLEYLQGLPSLLADQGMDAPPSGLESARRALMSDLEAYIDWMATDLLPRSSGTFRLGRYLLQRKLLYSDHVSLSLEELERLNANAINEYRQELAEVAEAIDPDRSPAEIIDSIVRVGPGPDGLLEAARSATVAARDWVRTSGVVELLRDDPPVVRESPPWARKAFASLDAPGPFESEELDAFLNLTTARETWDERQVEEHMSYFSDAGLALTALHNTFPGHYVQRQYEREMPELRRVLVTGAFVAGWAHYAADMAVDEGFSEDPAVRLEQLRRALQRHARWYAVMRLHAFDDPVDQVVDAFMRIAYFEEFPARREVLRATRNAGLLTDALGRMQIEELREDYREHLTEEGSSFSLADFHGRLLRLGLPYTLAREVLIPEDGDRAGVR